jgi:hypothetical protein
MRCASLLIFTLALSGCSAQLDREPVRTFAAQADTARAIVATYWQKERAAELNQLVIEEAARTGALPAIDGNCLGPGAPCVARVQQGALVPPERPSAAVANADAIAQYADTLVAIVDDESDSKLRTHVTGIADDLGKIAGNLNLPVPAAGPFTAIGADLAGLYLASRKAQALRDAVVAADPIIAAASDDLAKVVADWQANALTANANAITQLTERARALKQARIGYAPELREIADRTAEARQAIAAPAAVTVAKLKTAHAALRDAVLGQPTGRNP